MATPSGHQPPMPPVPTAQVGINVGAQVVAGPDGTPWVALDIAEGHTRHTIALPVRDAMPMAELVMSVLTQAAAQAGHQPAVVAMANGARRTPSGLVLP